MQTYEALYIGSLPVPRAMGKRRCSPVVGGRPGSRSWRGAGNRAAPARTMPTTGADGMGCPSGQGWMC